MGSNKTIPEAPESNAGDDFHILWTIKKSFNLFNFEDNGLKAITIEGIAIKEADKIDPTGKNLLGIDIVEFYGGENFRDAKNVVVSQLKYSTRRIDENWTFSKIYQGKKSNSSDGSIVHRLSMIFKTFLDEYGRDKVLKKLKIKLISNRNFNENQKNTILTFQKHLQNKIKPVRYTSISKLFSKSEELSFDKMYKASNLNLTEFSDFISLFNLDECGVNSRDFLDREITKSISDLSTSSTNEFNALHKLVWDKMMPESKRNNVITKEDVLFCFNSFTLEELFPVNQKFEENKNKVYRVQLPDILDAIKNNISKNPICLHGGAGIGKSTITQLIIENLPVHCESIIFDCYGGGDYLNPSDSRHLHREALIQLSNDLAKKLGTPFLLIKKEDNHILLREFKNRVKKAIEILKRRNPDAYLVLIIDAADNSITAAEEDLTISFVHDLLAEEFPKELKLIVTSRTNRKDTLKLPSGYIDILLNTFTEDETSKYIKQFFPEITTQEIKEFHNLTGGIPRVQFYTLDLKRQGINEVINYLKPNGKKVEDLILDKIREASKKIGENGEFLIGNFFKFLISLPRPVPLSYLVSLNEGSFDFYKDLATDIWNGLILHNNFLSFRDEDFENFIREEYTPNNDIKAKIADLFLAKSDTDEYASINLGNSLFIADYKNQLKKIVLENKFRKFPLDPIRNKEIYIERAKLAMKLSNNEDDNVTYFKLLMIAAEEAKKEKALFELLINNAELSALFGDESSLQKINLNSESNTWSGSFHLRLAAIYSRNAELSEKSKVHLKIAEKWIDWIQRLDDEKRKEYNISDKDIAFGAESYLRLWGSKKAFNWINRWIPKKVRLDSGLLLIDNIFHLSNDDQINSWIGEINFSLPAKIVLLNKLNQFGKPLFIDLKEVAEKLSLAIKRNIKFESYFYTQLIEFSELTMKLKVMPQSKIIQILGVINTDELQHVPSFYNKYYNGDEDLNMDLYLRKQTLLNVINSKLFDIEDFYPSHFKNIENIKEYEKRQSLIHKKEEFERFFKHAIPIYQLNADYYSTRIGKKEATVRLKNTFTSIGNDWNFRYRTGHNASEQLNYFGFKLVDMISCFDDKNEFIELVLNSSKNKDENQIKLKLLIANKLVYDNTLNSEILAILKDISESIENSSFLARDAVEYYIECSLIANKIESGIGRFYFDKAVDSVAEIDIEAYEQIKSLSSLTEIGITKKSPKLAYEFARFIEYSHVRLSGWDHFPFYQGILGIINLDLSSSYAIICRWDHRDIESFSKSIKTIIKYSNESEYIDHLTASSLLSLANNHYSDELVSIYKLLISKYKQQGNSSQNEYFLKGLIKDLMLSKNNSLLAVIYGDIKNDNHFNSKIISELKIYLDFYKSLKENNNSNIHSNEYDNKKNKHNINLDELIITSTSSLENAIVKIEAGLDKYDERLKVDDLLADIKKGCSVKNQVEHLDALIDIDQNLINFYSIENALEQRLKDWKYNPLVVIWGKEKFKYFLEKWFSHFDEDGYSLQIWQIKKFSDIFCIDDFSLSKILTDIIAQRIDTLSSESIYTSVELIKYKLTKQENEDIITWTLDKWNSKIDASVLEGCWSDNLNPPADSNEVIAHTLRYILGHPDKRERWGAVHSVRRIINLGNTEILKILLQKQNNKGCFPFQHNEFTFFWISSKLYLWIAIARVSKEAPEKLINFAKEFHKELINHELPHILIRYFIKQTCLNLITYNPDLYTSKETNNINNSLISKFPKVREERLSRKQGKYNTTDKDWKFPFNNLDTLPYWYSGLARRFNLSANDVADISDMFITDVWGFRGNPNKEDHVKAHGNDWYLMSNDHGSIPKIENLKTYYEYHAMFCAANDLLEKEPLIETDWRGDEFEYWLTSKANSWDEFWLYDLTDPVPLDIQYWEEQNKITNKNWKENIEQELYDDAVGIKDNIDFIIPYSNCTKYFGEDYETITIRSSLVSVKTSDALLRALISTKNSHDYAVPMEKDDLEIDKKKFIFKGWLKEIRSNDDGLDLHDTMANKTASYYITIGSEIQTKFNIDFSTDFKKSYFNKKIISTFHNWNDTSENRRYGNYESEGSIFKISKDFLLTLLKETDKCLIIECNISRQLKERDFKYDRENIKNTAKLYLIKPDGTVRTLREPDFRIR